MPPRKQRPDDTAVLTVRTSPEHRDVADLISNELVVSRSDLFALVFAKVCGLERPRGTPAVQIDLDQIAELAAKAVEELAEQKEMPKTA